MMLGRPLGRLTFFYGSNGILPQKARAKSAMDAATFGSGCRLIHAVGRRSARTLSGPVSIVRRGTHPTPLRYPCDIPQQRRRAMKGILAWAIGIPIPIIIILYFLDVF